MGILKQFWSRDRKRCRNIGKGGVCDKLVFVLFLESDYDLVVVEDVIRVWEFSIIRIFDFLKGAGNEDIVVCVKFFNFLVLVNKLII